MTSDFVSSRGWFDRCLKNSLAFRYPTMRLAFNLLYHSPSHHIVETGCMRSDGSIMEGNSTQVFGRFCALEGGYLDTIDISSLNIGVCKEITEKYEEWINYTVGDSVSILAECYTPIDLLYLDSMDCPIVGDATEAQMHQLAEIRAASHVLHDKSIVLLDDCEFSNGGKSRLSKKWLGKNGWVCLLDAYQSVWVKNIPPGS